MMATTGLARRQIPKSTVSGGLFGIWQTPGALTGVETSLILPHPLPAPTIPNFDSNLRRGNRLRGDPSRGVTLPRPPQRTHSFIPLGSKKKPSSFVIINCQSSEVNSTAPCWPTAPLVLGRVQGKHKRGVAQQKAAEWENQALLVPQRPPGSASIPHPGFLCHRDNQGSPASDPTEGLRTKRDPENLGIRVFCFYSPHHSGLELGRMEKGGPPCPPPNWQPQPQ